MNLQMPSAQLANLVNGISGGQLADLQVLPGGGGVTGLRLARAAGHQDRAPDEYRATPELAATDAQIAALINTGTGLIAVPALLTPSWLQIPVRWLPIVLGVPAANIPTAGFFAVSQESILNAQGGWIAFLQSIGWTPATPSVSGPLPVLNC